MLSLRYVNTGRKLGLREAGDFNLNMLSLRCVCDFRRDDM